MYTSAINYVNSKKVGVKDKILKLSTPAPQKMLTKDHQQTLRTRL